MSLSVNFTICVIAGPVCVDQFLSSFWVVVFYLGMPGKFQLDDRHCEFHPVACWMDTFVFPLNVLELCSRIQLSYWKQSHPFQACC